MRLHTNFRGFLTLFWLGLAVISGFVAILSFTMGDWSMFAIDIAIFACAALAFRRSRNKLAELV